MNYLDNITLCLTIGKRPNELSQTLESLFKFISFKHILAINDFGDEETNQVFKKYCPNGVIVNLDCQERNLGHHRAIDFLYSQIKTDYVFHCEDDWLFTSQPDLDLALQLLNNNEKISCVCFRKLSDFDFKNNEEKKFKMIQNNFGNYIRLDHLHEQWHGYSFNPHLAKSALWGNHQPFASFKKERHISRYLRSLGFHMAYLEQANCHHIGFESVGNPPKTFWQKLKFW